MSEIEDLPIKLKNKFDDGGPFYPWSDIKYSGITRRDWLAGLAMQTLLNESPARNGDVEWQVKVSWKAYSIADAMIAEGRKGGNQ